MWRAKLGERAGERHGCSARHHTHYGVSDEATPPPAPAWTMTPLFQEVQRVKEVAARLALEHAATSAQNGRLRAELASVREELSAHTTRVDDAEAVRERDVHHLKADIQRLQTEHARERDASSAAAEAQRVEFERRLAEAAATHANSLRALSSSIEARHVEMVQAATEQLTAQRSREATARDELEERSWAARGVLRDDLALQLAELRESVTRDAVTMASGLESAKAATEALRTAAEDRASGLDGAISAAAEAVQRAIETKLATLHTTIVRLDRHNKEQASEIEDARTESSSKLREAGEERVQIESRVAALEGRMQLAEREAAAMADAAARSMDPYL